MLQSMPIPGHPAYTINTQGKVFHNGKPKSLIYKKGKAPKLRIQAGYKKQEWGVAMLMATLFLPNPCKYTRVVFKDGDPHNLQLDNIQWICNRLFVRHNLHRNLPLQPLPKQKIQKPLPPACPLRVPIENMPGYFISPKGLIYKGNQLLKTRCDNGRAPQARLQCSWSKSGYCYPGLATLVAQHFIPNPKRHSHIIFKDRNNRNCSVDNIAWVDAATYLYYCTGQVGSRKKCGTREEAIRRCKDEDLLMYYKTGDESWLQHCWQRMVKQIRSARWQQHMAECYFYFLDRARRFTLYHDPAGLLVLHCRHLRKLERNHRYKFSGWLKGSRLRRADESLR